MGKPLEAPEADSTLTYQNLQKSRVPINSILGFIIRTYKKVGFGRLRYDMVWEFQQTPTGMPVACGISTAVG